MEKAVIFDLDNVLFNSLILDLYVPEDLYDVEGWDILASHFKSCTANPWCVDLVKKYITTHTIIFVTSRNDKGDARKITSRCIQDAIGTSNYKLYMRTDGDFSSSHILKREIYTKYIGGRYDITFVIDDDLSNCIMWDSLGIPTLHKII